MTNPNESNELIELSKRVAEKIGIEADKYYKYCHDPKIDEVIWLHEDSKRCFELMCEYRISLLQPHDSVCTTKKGPPVFTFIDQHNKDRALATRVAILKALEAL